MRDLLLVVLAFITQPVRWLLPEDMTVPLIILAIPAVGLGLLVGLPPEGGSLHTFLEPVFYETEHEAFRWIGERVDHS